jgi:hypothetical protein
VLEGLHSILSIPENPDGDHVTLFHSSFQDFLTSESRAGAYFIDPVLMNTDLAKLCLGCIATLPKFSFPTLRDPMQCWNPIKVHLEQQDGFKLMELLCDMRAVIGFIILQRHRII